MNTSVVLSNGTLDESKLIKREKLYKGMNGRYVERFYVTPTESYIFKPLTNESQIGKEIWVYENILTCFPAIFPKILAHSVSNNPNNSWLIYEDLGKLQHKYDKDLLLRVTRWMAWWHSLPIQSLMNASLNGPKPMFEEIVVSVMTQKERVFEILMQHGFSKTFIEIFFDKLDNTTFSQSKVLSHGDLHLGNYAYYGENVIVLDWEHAHLNSPYWDLYHLIDISHPDFFKDPTEKIRNLVLDYYLDETNCNLDENRKKFKHEYYLFSITFSVWMVLLIKSDLESNVVKWSKSQLEQQLMQTITTISQCWNVIIRE